MKIFAHRGASKEAKENTVEAFQKALEIGVDGVEFDCLVTREGVPVVHHNDDVLDPEKGILFLREMSLEQTRVFGIPTLEEVLPLFARHPKCLAIFDIKAQPGFIQQAPLAVASLAESHLHREQILFTSFSWRHLFLLQRHFPGLPRAIILNSASFKLVPIVIFDKLLEIRAVHPRTQWLSPTRVGQWQRHGIDVNAWVANTEEEIRVCKAMGVDGIFTDDPRLAKKILGT